MLLERFEDACKEAADGNLYDAVRRFGSREQLACILPPHADWARTIATEAGRGNSSVLMNAAAGWHQHLMKSSWSSGTRASAKSRHRKAAKRLKRLR